MHTKTSAKIRDHRRNNIPILLSSEEYPMNVNTQYDLLIIGGGPGGTPAAIALAQAGKRVLLVRGRARSGRYLSVRGLYSLEDFPRDRGAPP